MNPMILMALLGGMGKGGAQSAPGGGAPPQGAPQGPQGGGGGIDLMGALGGGMGGQPQQQQPQQDQQQPIATTPIAPTFPAMTGGGATPSSDLMQSPIFAASAYRDRGLGAVAPHEDVPQDSLMRVGQRAQQGPASMSGWEKFNAYLKGMPTDQRLMLGMSGLDGLRRTLSGKL